MVDAELLNFSAKKEDYRDRGFRKTRGSFHKENRGRPGVQKVKADGIDFPTL